MDGPRTGPCLRLPSNSTRYATWTGTPFRHCPDRWRSPSSTRPPFPGRMRTTPAKGLPRSHGLDGATPRAARHLAGEPASFIEQEESGDDPAKPARGLGVDEGRGAYEVSIPDRLPSAPQQLFRRRDAESFNGLALAFTGRWRRRLESPTAIRGDHERTASSTTEHPRHGASPVRRGAETLVSRPPRPRRSRRGRGGPEPGGTPARRRRPECRTPR